MDNELTKKEAEEILQKILAYYRLLNRRQEEVLTAYSALEGNR